MHMVSWLEVVVFWFLRCGGTVSPVSPRPTHISREFSELAKAGKSREFPRCLFLPDSSLPPLMKAQPRVLGCPMVKARLTHGHLWQKGKHHHYHHYLTKADPVSMLGPGCSGQDLYGNIPLPGPRSELCAEYFIWYISLNLHTSLMG